MHISMIQPDSSQPGRWDGFSHMNMLRLWSDRTHDNESLSQIRSHMRFVIHANFSINN